MTVPTEVLVSSGVCVLQTLRQLFRFLQSPAARLKALRQQALCLSQLLQTGPAEVSRC